VVQVVKVGPSDVLMLRLHGVATEECVERLRAEASSKIGVPVVVVSSGIDLVVIGPG